MKIKRIDLSDQSRLAVAQDIARRFTVPRYEQYLTQNDLLSYNPNEYVTFNKVNYIRDTLGEIDVRLISILDNDGHLADRTKVLLAEDGLVLENYVPASRKEGRDAVRASRVANTEKTSESNQVKKPARKSIDWTRLGVLIGVIASIIAIIGFASGVQSIPQFFSLVMGRQRIATPTSVPPTPSFEVPLEQLLTGAVELPITSFSRTFRLGYNFKLGQFASGSIPADLIFMNCSAQSPFFNLYCDMHGTHLWNQGNLHLSEIIVPDSRGVDTLPNEILEVGETYVLQAYDGHLVKFRVSNLELLLTDDLPTGANIVIEYVYQTNNRDDFLGP